MTSGEGTHHCESSVVLSRVTQLIADIDGLLAGLSPVERAIVDRRLCSVSPETLEQVGEPFGLTRERIRQVQVVVKRKFDRAVGTEPLQLARILSSSWGPFLPAEEFDQRMTEVVPTSDPSSLLVAGMLRLGMGFRDIAGQLTNSDGQQQIQHLKSIAHALSDDVGLIDESELRSELAISSEEHWSILIANSGLHRISGFLALRESNKAQIKAALLEIGRPATKDEIAEGSGVVRSKLGSQLSVIPSVVRSDKYRWGMREWVEDQYDGIPAEIRQRIDEDGGVTRMDRLLTELPAKFGISAASVKSYVSTSQFLLRDGYVTLADESTIRYRPLDDVISGRDIEGRPYWDFVVEQRFFDGYSVVGIPPEIVREIGCPPNGRIRVELDSPSDCLPVSVNWRLDSIPGAEMGYLSQPLTRLQLRPGDRARLLLTGAGVSLTAATGEAAGDSGESPEELLERMKSRRRAL